MHRDKGVAEERAEEIEEGDDAVGVFERHGRPSRDQLQQWHHGAEGAERRRGTELAHTTFFPTIRTKSCLLKIILRSPSDHLRCHGSYQVPEVPQETCVES